MAYLLCFINSWLENSAVIMYSLYSYSYLNSKTTPLYRPFFLRLSGGLNSGVLLYIYNILNATYE